MCAVLERQPGRRLVQNVERLAGGALGQFGGELDSLRLAAAQLRGRLSEPYVAESDVVHRLELALYARNVLEMLQSLGYCHVQNLRYVRALPLYLQRLAIVARSVANFAGNRDVGKELHLDIDVAVPGAGLAPTALDVERESARLVASRARFGHCRKQFTDWRESAGVGGRIGARSAANRGLVYVHHLVYVLDSGYRVAVARSLTGAIEGLRELLVQDFVDQCALARSRDAGDANKLSERYFDIYVAQVVLSRSLYDDGLSDALSSGVWNGYLLDAAQILASQRLGLADNVFDGPRGDYVTAMLSGAGA